MKPEEALALLNNACSQIQATRADHVRLQQAVDVLRESIEDKPDD